MDSPEKVTYLVFRHGRDPEKLRLGNLVIFPSNPEESDPFLCPYKVDELGEWTGTPQENSDIILDITDSQDLHASIEASGLVKGELSGSRGSSLKLRGKSAFRYQIDQAEEFLNRVILNCAGAKQWLSSRITLARNIYYLNLLNLGKPRHPSVWMVTGIQLISDATVCVESTSSSNINASFQIPPPDIASAIAVVLGGDGGVRATAGASMKRSNKDEHRHVGQRVWAAQFRRLKVDFVKEGRAVASTAQNISLYNFVHLGHRGIRGSAPQELGTVQIAGVNEAYANAAAAAMQDKALFDRLSKPSSKRALLLGGSEKSLRGIRRDIKEMNSLLQKRGFHVSICLGESATRNGILRACFELIEQIEQHDTVVLYFSGHGGSSEPTSPHGEQRTFQYIVPSDVEQTTESDFRGILDVELSHIAACLTDKTPNVTIILDCCHSERAARGAPGLRTWSPLSRQTIESHIDRLGQAGLSKLRLHAEANPYSVRIAASESDKPAFEDSVPRCMAENSENSEQQYMGNLTRELVAELQAVGDGIVSWDAILSQLRIRLERHNQRPQIEGPKMRALFSLQKLDYWGQLGLRVRSDRVSLMGGLLTEVRVGDEYAILPRTALFPDSSKQIAVATVWAVTPVTAKVDLRYTSGQSYVPDGARAFPLRRFRSGYRIQLQVDAMLLRDCLQSRLSASKLIHDSDKDIDNSNTNPFGILKEDSGKLCLLHQNADPVFEYSISTSDYENAAIDAIYQFEKLARADQILKLAPERNYALDSSSVSIEIGRVQRRMGSPEPFSDESNYSYTEGQYAYLKIVNKGPYKLFAAVFLITSIGTIEWLSNGSPSGAELRENALNTYIPKQGSYDTDVDRIKGMRFKWPSSVPRRGPLKEAFVIVLTNRKVDLGCLGTQYTEERIRRELDEESDDDDDGDEDCVRFAVRRINFNLIPTESVVELPRRSV